MTTGKAAEILGVTTTRVRQLIEQKRLPAIKEGRDYQINESDLELVRERVTGRPKRINESTQ